MAFPSESPDPGSPWPLPPERDLDFAIIDAAVRSLSERQRAILVWIAFGKNNSEIARLFDLSLNSIEREVSVVLAALNHGSRHRATAAYFFWISRTHYCQSRTGTLAARSQACPIHCAPGALFGDGGKDPHAAAEKFPLPSESAVDAEKIDAALEELTSRQRAMIEWIAHGATNPEIVETFSISLKTVERDITLILETLEAESRHAAAGAFLHWSCCHRDTDSRPPDKPSGNDSPPPVIVY